MNEEEEREKGKKCTLLFIHGEIPFCIKKIK